MKKVVVLFKSKYGTAKKYATWLGEEAKGDVYPIHEVKIEDIEKYDIIIYCGGLYAGGILGFSFIKKNYDKLNGKKIIVVAVGATLKKEEAKEEVKSKNIPTKMRKNVEFFLLRGGISYSKMNFLDRLLMFIMVNALKLKKQEDLNDDAKGIIATYGKDVDFTHKDAIAPIIELVK